MNRGGYSDAAPPRTRGYLGVGVQGANMEGLSEETKLDLARVERADRDMDVELARIDGGVGQLKDIAMNMKHNLTVQDHLIDDVKHDLDEVGDGMDIVNSRLKEAARKAKSNSKFYWSLLCLLLLVVQVILISVIATQK